MDNAFIAQLLHWRTREPLRWQRPINKVFSKLGVNVEVRPRTPTYIRINGKKYWTMGNIESRMNVFYTASQCAAMNIPGEMVELGCNSGESSIIIQRIIDHYAPDKKLYCFDSFEGLPQLNGEDAREGVYLPGSMEATLQLFHDNFARANTKPPEHVYKGWFEDTVPQNLPDKISFAMLDGDLYSSTKYILPHVYERLSPGAICIFGVYYNDEIYSKPNTLPHYKSPGVKRATDEFFADKPEKVSVLIANEYSNGYFRKQ